jgi:hypothetical protein
MLNAAVAMAGDGSGHNTAKAATTKSLKASRLTVAIDSGLRRIDMRYSRSVIRLTRYMPQRRTNQTLTRCVSIEYVTSMLKTSGQ